MRIGSISQISQLYQMNTTAKKNTKTTGSQLDAISISSAGKDYQVAKSALSKISDVRQDRVEQLKKQKIKVSGFEFFEAFRGCGGMCKSAGFALQHHAEHGVDGVGFVGDENAVALSGMEYDPASAVGREDAE